MINADIIARTHFTSKVDGKTSFETWKRALKLQDEKLPFEYESKSLGLSISIHFVIESWGGFENASGQWTIFVAWRSTKGAVMQYIHWTWDDRTNTCSNRRDYGFVG